MCRPCRSPSSDFCFSGVWCLMNVRPVRWGFGSPGVLQWMKIWGGCGAEVVIFALPPNFFLWTRRADYKSNYLEGGSGRLSFFFKLKETGGRDRPRLSGEWRCGADLGSRTAEAGFGLLPRPAKIVTWLILPVVICLSQRLSHACLSISMLCETADGSLKQLWFIWWFLNYWIPVVILELIHVYGATHEVLYLLD